MEMTGQVPVPVVLVSGEQSSVHLGYEAESGRCTDKIYPTFLPGIKLRILGRPAHILDAIPTELFRLLVRNESLFFIVTLILQNKTNLL
jgi:hypothetical protein